MSNPLYDAQAGNEVTDNDTALYESGEQVNPADPYYDKAGNLADQPVHKEPVYEDVTAARERRAEDDHYDVA